MVKIGIIGGSGLDDPDILKDKQEIEAETPYGKPSDKLSIGTISGIDVVIISRHGKKHSIMPSNVNFRANIWALKEQGCTHVLASTACGSLREEIAPGTLVFPDQYIDRTTKRHCTFHDKDKVCHIAMEQPFCEKLRELISETAKELGLKHCPDKTVITIEGPKFSTKAESRMYRAWGADIINMSTVPEVVLAREAGLCYQAIAMATDYDCFAETKENVTWEQIVKIMKQNSENVKRLWKAVIPKIKDEECSCKTAINSALV
ncbi:S-methyl-5'-thioadenosine phosphorylase [Candidatus Woesearchaeota archaeon]|nr:S-methyl-5'-thioadenosine phosphorylase [Candidatus Woesearchaeota archaeon]